VKSVVENITEESDWQALQKNADLFMETLASRFSPVSMQWEVPVLAADKAGSVISGAIDLLMETGDGYWILDHKTDETDNREKRFNQYLPQLDCYAKAISEGMGLKVAGVAIHWVCYCEISCLSVDK
jgi:ATP-dependent exoDNAse (exonuclease V) beta subunit